MTDKIVVGAEVWITPSYESYKLSDKDFGYRFIAPAQHQLLKMVHPETRIKISCLFDEDLQLRRIDFMAMLELKEEDDDDQSA